MKKYLFAFVAVAFLFLTSLVYKSHNAPRLRHFPLKSIETGKKEEASKIYLYVFLSARNCRECLSIIHVLNRFTNHHSFEVIGVVPTDELREERMVRLSTGAQFPLIPESMYKKHIPVYTPAVVGVSESEELLFLLPGLKDGDLYLETFLLTLLEKYRR